jgi:hypothetical protein
MLVRREWVPTPARGNQKNGDKNVMNEVAKFHGHKKNLTGFKNLSGL